MLRVLGLISFFIIQASFAVESLTFRSGNEQMHLLELYSSQGCSSCPPAQHWVNQLSNSEMLWRKVVPVVFHVDYWDYLGWKDKFSQSVFSQRQRTHKREGNIKSVYTPGFCDGRARMARLVQTQTTAAKRKRGGRAQHRSHKRTL